MRDSELAKLKEETMYWMSVLCTHIESTNSMINVTITIAI